MKTLRQRVLLKAWRLIREEGMTFSRALKFAWKVVKRAELRDLLSHAIVTVTFMKVSGEITTRTVTRNASFIPAEFAPKGENTKKYGTITFFSLSDGGWRSFRSDNLIRYKVA